MPDPRSVYVEELSTLFNGRAVLNPRRCKLKSGRGLRAPIDVGDVVYDYEGQLTRLFNCLKSASEQDEDSVLPEGFEMLTITFGDNTMPITVDTRETHAGPYFSKGVRRIGADAGAFIMCVLVLHIRVFDKLTGPFYIGPLRAPTSHFPPLTSKVPSSSRLATLRLGSPLTARRSNNTWLSTSTNGALFSPPCNWM